MTQAECTAAAETARAICCMARTGCICYDLDGNLIEDYNESKTRKRDVMVDDFEDRWKREEKDTRLSNSSSTSRQVDSSSDSAGETPFLLDFCDSCLAKMDQSHSKLEAQPKWSAHVEWSNPSGEESAASILLPWRDQSLWRITTTKTIEGLSGQPECGAKQHYEALLKKHAIEYTKLMREYEDMKAKEHEDMKLAGA